MNFGAIKDKLAITYTAKGAPGTNEAKARNLARDTPAPLQQPVTAARADSYDFAAMLSLTAGRAASAFTDKLPDGAERRFVTERADPCREAL